ncbi:hypothetical protein KCU67_g12418, partial [Aureobasidium melanogenum]
MSDPKATGAGGSKSRTGCSECKRKRVKCDEGKPSCGRCKRHPERCSYELKLSWTQGRPFKKPRTKEPWVINLGASVATSDPDATQPASVAPAEEETADKATSSAAPQLLSLPGIPHNSDIETSNALQPFDDSIGLDDYEDSFLLPEDSTLADTNLLDDLDFEPADETIERNVSLLPFQHYSPPNTAFALGSSSAVLRPGTAPPRK